MTDSNEKERQWRRRYDGKIDSKCFQLGLKQCDLLKDEVAYKKFIKEEYDPQMNKIKNYLLGKTDEYPL
jgi:hypothetical protein